MPRRHVIGAALLAAVLVAGAALLALPSPSSPPATHRHAAFRCVPAAVHYEAPPGGAHAAGLPRDLPWVASRDARVIGFLFFQATPEYARLYVPHPRRVLVPIGGTVAPGVNAKILWWLRGGGVSADPVVLTGRRAHGRATLRQALGNASVLPSIVNIPSPGCWLLTIRRGTLAASVAVGAAQSGRSSQRGRSAIAAR